MNSGLGRNEPSAKSSVTPSHIRAADALIATHIRRTPIVETPSPIAEAPPVSLKLECLQHSGSFKARGAFHNLLTRPAPPAGCATASGGNHGAAVAYAARKLGVKARIFVPEIATSAKIGRIRAYGAEAVISGASYAEAQQRCDAYVAESGALPIHPYDAPETIAGAGTVAMEWEDDLRRLALPALDTVLVAVGGGGLISGVAAWFEGRIKVVGVEPEGSRALDAALQAGAPVDVPVASIAADLLGASVSAASTSRSAGDRSERSSWFRTRRSSRRSAGSGARSRSSPNRAAPRPSRRWRAAPIGRKGASGSASSSAGRTPISLTSLVFSRAGRPKRGPSGRRGSLDSLGFSGFSRRISPFGLDLRLSFPWIFLDFLVRIVTFQWVAELQPKKKF